MRFILLNAANDRRLAPLRRLHIGKMQRRPTIGGKPLPTGARRVLDRAQLTGPMLVEICHHVQVGNVRFIQVGKKEPLDFHALADACGFTGLFSAAEELVPPVVPDAEEPPFVEEPVLQADDSGKVVTARVGIVDVAVTAGDDGVLGTEDDEVVVSRAEPAEPAEPALDLEEILEEPVVEDSEDPLPEDEFAIPDGFEDFLSGKKNRALQPLLEMLGGVSTGKRKALLVSEIMEALHDEAVDPVAARKAIEKALAD